MRRLLWIIFGFYAQFLVAQNFRQDIITGAEQFERYVPQLTGKRVAVVANQTSVVGNIHLVDTLLAKGVNVVKVFAPEHGFRGKADAGEHVKNDIDVKTGLPIISLYGKNKKPSAHQLHDVDAVVFDIQDVGARFYTYISTMHYVMEACAENVKEFWVLDRPNPNGFYIDGPVLKKKFKSFVGMHPIPVVHGLTVGELAMMINGEKWLKNGIECDLKVVSCENYTHKDLYQLPIKPSPNLPNMSAVFLYPSLCFFEGTVISVGRGTDKPFQVFGHPLLTNTTYDFVPVAMPGAANPKLKGEVCHGFDLSEFGLKEMPKYKGLYLNWLINAYKNYPKKEEFFNEQFFDLLAGTDQLRLQIIEGKTEKEIKQSWQEDLNAYKQLRKKYLLYEDF